VQGEGQGLCVVGGEGEVLEVGGLLVELVFYEGVLLNQLLDRLLLALHFFGMLLRLFLPPINHPL